MFKKLPEEQAQNLINSYVDGISSKELAFKYKISKGYYYWRSNYW